MWGSPYLLEYLHVRGGKFMITNLVGRNPFKGGATQRFRFVLQPATLEESQVNFLFGIRVRHRREHLANFRFDPKFLAEFATQTFFESFISVPFAAGNFPHASEM